MPIANDARGLGRYDFGAASPAERTSTFMRVWRAAFKSDSVNGLDTVIKWYDNRFGFLAQIVERHSGRYPDGHDKHGQLIDADFHALSTEEQYEEAREKARTYFSQWAVRVRKMFGDASLPSFVGERTGGGKKIDKDKVLADLAAFEDEDNILDGLNS